MNLNEKVREEMAQPFKNGLAKAKKIMEDSEKEVDGLTLEEIDVIIKKNHNYINTTIVNEIYDATVEVINKHNLTSIIQVTKESISKALRLRLTIFSMRKIVESLAKESANFDSKCDCEHCKCEKSSITVDEKGNLKNENNI